MIELQEENEFVDYYALLELPPNADESDLRRRIFDLYDEARHNLDHRSHRKRFYYVSLYETHLARARHFLLDSDRRPRYDSCLRAFQAGQPFDYRALFEKTVAAQNAGQSAPPAVPSQPEATPETPVAPAPASSEPGAAVAKTTTPPPSAPVAPAPSAPAGQPQAPPAATSAAVTAAPPVATVAVAAPAAEAPAPGQSESAARLEKLLRTPTLDPAQIGRRRDFQRRELIGGELKAQGRFATMITFSITLLLGTMTLWNLEMSLIYPKEGTMSPTDMVVVVVSLALLCGVALLAGWYASRLTRRHIIAKLSRMSYDELLRHCRA